jgi:hypothetical protein
VPKVPPDARASSRKPSNDPLVELGPLNESGSQALSVKTTTKPENTNTIAASLAPGREQP